MGCNRTVTESIPPRDSSQYGALPVGEKESENCDPVYGSDNIKLVKSGKSAVSYNVVSEQASVPTVPGIAYVMAITFVTGNGISVDRCKAAARDIPNLSTLVLLRTLQVTSGNTKPSGTNGSISASSATVYIPMLPVLINGESVMCFLDNGSTNTFMAQSLASRLGLSGPKEHISINTLSDKTQSNPMIVTCDVSNTDGTFLQCLNTVLVTPYIPARLWQETFQICPHWFCYGRYRSFNPPHASHHGGLSEQMIQTIHQILVALLVTNMRLNDDVLHTGMCEVENLINSRLLTK